MTTQEEFRSKMRERCESILAAAGAEWWRDSISEEKREMTLAEWRKAGTCIETGDTGRTVYTDERVSYSVFDVEDRFFYVEHDEIDEKQTRQSADGRARPIEGVRVELLSTPCWVSAVGPLMIGAKR